MVPLYRIQMFGPSWVGAWSSSFVIVWSGHPSPAPIGPTGLIVIGRARELRWETKLAELGKALALAEDERGMSHAPRGLQDYSEAPDRPSGPIFPPIRVVAGTCLSRVQSDIDRAAPGVVQLPSAIHLR